MIRTLSLGLAATAMLVLAGSAGAQPQQAVRDICVGPGGRSEPVACSAAGGRLGVTEYACICPTNAMRVAAPVCPKGVSPPPESAAYERAREAAARDGSLVGDVFEGRPMCIAPSRL